MANILMIILIEIINFFLKSAFGYYAAFKVTSFCWQYIFTARLPHCTVGTKAIYKCSNWLDQDLKHRYLTVHKRTNKLNQSKDQYLDELSLGQKVPWNEELRI